MTTPRLSGDQGFTSVTFLLVLMLLIITMGALSVELWHLISEHRQVAGIVDGAAISAAAAVDEAALRAGSPPVLDSSAAIGRACVYLQEHAGLAVCPGPDASIEVVDGTVTVSLRREIDLTLMRVLAGFDPQGNYAPVEVVASSTAGIRIR